MPFSFHKFDVVALVRAGSDHFVSTIKARLLANEASKIPLSWHALFIQLLLLIKKINVSAQLMSMVCIIHFYGRARKKAFGSFGKENARIGSAGIRAVEQVARLTRRKD